jgi:hypothetical protein
MIDNDNDDLLSYGVLGKPEGACDSGCSLTCRWYQAMYLVTTRKSHRKKRHPKLGFERWAFLILLVESWTSPFRFVTSRWGVSQRFSIILYLYHFISDYNDLIHLNSFHIISISVILGHPFLKPIRNTLYHNTRALRGKTPQIENMQFQNIFQWTLIAAVDLVVVSGRAPYVSVLVWAADLVTPTHHSCWSILLLVWLLCQHTSSLFERHVGSIFWRTAHLRNTMKRNLRYCSCHSSSRGTLASGMGQGRWPPRLTPAMLHKTKLVAAGFLWSPWYGNVWHNVVLQTT